MRPGDRAWLALAAGVIAYEAWAPNGELLSQACDRYRQRHPVLSHLIILYIPLHLARLWPERIDPLTQLASRLGR